MCMRHLVILATLILGAGGWAQAADPWQRMLRSDRDADGRISRDEFRGAVRVFERMDADGNGVIEEAEFTKVLEERGRAEPRREAAPPGVGEAAPDFTLPEMGSVGQEQPRTVSLASLRGKPVLLIFGSYT